MEINNEDRIASRMELIRRWRNGYRYAGLDNIDSWVYYSFVNGAIEAEPDTIDKRVGARIPREVADILSGYPNIPYWGRLVSAPINLTNALLLVRIVETLALLRAKVNPNREVQIVTRSREHGVHRSGSVAQNRATAARRASHSRPNALGKDARDNAPVGDEVVQGRSLVSR